MMHLLLHQLVPNPMPVFPNNHVSIMIQPCRVASLFMRVMTTTTSLYTISRNLIYTKVRALYYHTVDL